MQDNYRGTINENERELLQYYHDLKHCLQNQNYDHYSDTGIAIREKLNILIKKILTKIIKYEVIVENNMGNVSGPVIYASTHQDFHDIINSIYTYPDHILTLNASNISKKLKVLLELNGVIFVDREDRESRKKAYTEMQKALAKGKSVSVYPEATLNCTPSKLHLPLYKGIVNLSQSMGVPIIPVVQEYTYNQEKLDGKSHVTKVNVSLGSPVYVGTTDDIYEKLGEVSEQISTMRWKIIESKGAYKRSDISNGLYVDYIKARIRDWRIPNNDIVEERRQILGASDDFYLFHHVNDVEFDENGNFIPTSYVRKLETINRVHGI